MSRASMLWRQAPTAILATALGAAIAYSGLQLLRAGLSSATMEAGLLAVTDIYADPVPDFGPLRDERRRWVDTPGARASARQDVAMLAALVDEPDDAAFEDTLYGAVVDLFRIEPAVPGYWPVLADIRSDRGEPAAAIQAAFEMSRVVERYESPAMAQRIETGLWLWESLAPNQRDGVIEDLVAMRSRLGDDQLSGLAEMLADKSTEARRDIRAAIEGRIGNDPWIDKVGV